VILVRNVVWQTFYVCSENLISTQNFTLQGKSKKNHNIPKETEQLLTHFWKTNLRMATLSKMPTLAMVTTADDPP